MKAEEQILDSISRNAREEMKKGSVRIRLGTVISASPIKIRVAETEQSAEHFWCDAALLSGYKRSALSNHTSGELSVSAGCSEGSISSMTVNGGTLQFANIELLDCGFAPADQLLLLTDDDQIFYIMAKVVKLI